MPCEFSFAGIYVETLGSTTEKAALKGRGFQPIRYVINSVTHFLTSTSVSMHLLVRNVFGTSLIFVLSVIIACRRRFSPFMVISFSGNTVSPLALLILSQASISFSHVIAFFLGSLNFLNHMF